MKIPGTCVDISDLDWSVSFDPVSDPWRINILAHGDQVSLDSLYRFYEGKNQAWMMAIWYEWVAERFDKPQMYKAAADALSNIAQSSYQAKRAQEHFVNKYD